MAEGEVFSFNLQNPNAYGDAIQSHIEQCFQFCSRVSIRLEWGVGTRVHESDGVTKLKGWFKVISQNSDDVMYSNSDFSCGVMTYLLSLPDIDEDFIFRGCVARQVLNIFGFS